MKKYIKIISALLLAAVITVSGLLLPGTSVSAISGGPGSGEPRSIWDDYHDISLANWMAKVPDNIRINQLNIPGTHDSGTFHVRGGSSGYASTQECQIDQQFLYGIRVLDIRLGIYLHSTENDDVDDLLVYHGVFNCTVNQAKTEFLRFTHVLKYCDDFLKAHPTETIILKLQDEDDDYHVRRIMNDLQKKYSKDKKDHYVYYDMGDTIPTLGEVRGRVVMIDNDTGNGGTYTKYEDHYQESTIESKMQYVRDALDYSGKQDFTTVDTFKKEGFANVEGKRGEPAVKVVFSSNNALFQTWEILTIHDFSEEINKMLATYNYKAGTRYGWILMDFPTESPSMIRQIIYSNALPSANAEFKIEWNDERRHEPVNDFDFFVMETNTGEAVENLNWRLIDGSVIQVTNLPTCIGKYVCDYRIVPELPAGYTYNVIKNKTATDGTLRYTLSIDPPPVITLKINWRMFFGELPDPEEMEFYSYSQNIENPSEKKENTIYRREVRFNEDGMTIINFDADDAAHGWMNCILPVFEEGSGYVFQPENDFRRVDDHNYEVSVYPAGPYAEGLEGKVTFSGEIEGSDERDRRPPAGSTAWDGVKIIGRVGGEIVARAPVTPYFADYDSDGIVYWKVERAPVCDAAGNKIEWSAEFPPFTGYTFETEGFNAVYTPVHLQQRQGIITFVENGGSTGLRPASTDKIWKEFYLVGTTKNGDKSLKDPDVIDFSRYESDGIITWKAVHMPEFYHDGEPLEWGLNVPDFFGYDSEVTSEGDNIDLTLTLTSFPVVVLGGTADKTAAGYGETVTVTESVPEGKTFLYWTNVPAYKLPGKSEYCDVTFDNSTQEQTSFTMPPGPVIIQTVDIYAKPEAGIYQMFVLGGTAEPDFGTAGTEITIKAAVPDGIRFVRWEYAESDYGDLKIADASSAETTFTLPDSVPGGYSLISIKAVLEPVIPSSGGGPLGSGEGGTDETPDGLFTVSVRNGIAGYSAAEAGTPVWLMADAKDGMEFDHWTTVPKNLKLDDANCPFAIFNMPAENVALLAVYREDTPAVYTAAVGDGTAGSGLVSPGHTVALSANEPLEGQFFTEWKVLYGNPEIADKTSPDTTLTMPEGNVALKAVYGFNDVERHEYSIIRGNGSVYTQGSGGTLSLTCDGAAEKFYVIYIDGDHLETEDKEYTVASGSTIVTLKNSFLESLSAGWHTFVFRYDDGTSDTGRFLVTAPGPRPNPNTGV